MPNKSDIVTIEINGKKYEDWESAWIHQEFPGVVRDARLSVAEGNPAARTVALANIKPGDKCTISLGGALAISGYVTQRQTYADANRHGVLIEAQSFPGDLIRTSILGTQRWENKTIIDIAKDVLKPFSIEMISQGDTSNMSVPFPGFVVAMPGESAYHLIERLAREKKCWLGDNEKGSFVMDGGTQGGGGGATLEEGKNIKWLRVTICDIEVMSHLRAIAQGVSDNKNWGRSQTEPSAEEKDESMKRYKPYTVAMERPGTPGSIQKELKNRVSFEKAWRASTKIRAEICVQGWTKPGGGGLWAASPQEKVKVKSEMGMLDQELIIKEVTFTQDQEQGSQTVLLLVDPASYSGANRDLGQ